MSTLHSDVSIAEPLNDAFAADVRAGLGGTGQKTLPPTWFYDEVGSALFEVITLLPEYGLTRADARLIQRHAGDIARLASKVSLVTELGSGSGKKTRFLLEALQSPVYRPIDVSASALAGCAAQLGPYADVRPIEASYMEGMERVALERDANSPMLVLFLGSTIGNFDRQQAVEFLSQLRACLRSGDLLLMGADLVKAEPVMLAAYDDSLGVTAAFNRNVLLRMNRELGANFDQRDFTHEARWSVEDCRIEMHLRSSRKHSVNIPGAALQVRFEEGETIWTESSHKYTLESLERLSADAGFQPMEAWVDSEWPFAECLWRVS